MTISKPKKSKKVDVISHGKQSRPNIPTAEMEGLVRKDENQPLSVEYARNKDLDPQLCWRGKDEENNGNLKLQGVPIYTQEKIHPQAIINDLRRQTAQNRQQIMGEQTNLFADFNGLPEDSSVEFYQHRQKWTNRMILGDSLLVMTSLAHKEGLKGKVQCIYMDPPYGIKFASNWQVSTKKIETKDNEEAIEPEVIQAFRDTWKWGINSYLSYLRDRLTVARDLLTESGSFFLQIGDENIHLAAMLMDEVFGAENRVATISYATATNSSTKYLPQVSNYLLWYAKEKEQIKYKPLFESLDRKRLTNLFSDLELSDSTTQKLSKEQCSNPDKIPLGARMFKKQTFAGQGLSETGRSESYRWQNAVYQCPKNSQWPVSMEGMDRMNKANRLYAASEKSLGWKKYESEFAGKKISNMWSSQMSPGDKKYVVQTSDKVIQRCMLMTTDPGDLVLDPTCGSGTTASVAEQWGRRWVTIDTSRVAIAIARARLMGNQYDYYLMQDSEEGAKKEAELSGKPSTQKQYGNDVQHGFVCRRVKTFSPKHIAYNKEIDEIWDKHQPKIKELQKQFNAAAGTKYKEEWEIPHLLPEGANAATKKAHANFCNERRKRQQEMDISIAANAETQHIVDDPYKATNTVRVTGPFTMESLSPHRILPTDSTDEELLAAEDAELQQKGKTPPKRESRRLRPKSETDNETSFEKVIYENLKTSGVLYTHKKERLRFTELEPWATSQRIQYLGRYEKNGKEKKAAIVIGPEYGTVTRSLLIAAAREAADMFDMLIIMGFAFEGYADKELAHIGDLPVVRVRLNNELHMELKPEKDANLFVVFGEPDIELHEVENNMLEVEILGIDIFNPKTGEVKTSDTTDIACWMIDTDYNEESFFVRHAYFTGGGKDSYQKLKRALNNEIDVETWESLYRNRSRPFAKPTSGKIAVKAINHFGDEVIKIFTTGSIAKKAVTKSKKR